MRVPEFAEKANILPIIRAHIDTLASYRDGRRSFKDIGFFFGGPILIGAILDGFHFGFRLDAVTGFLGAFAILTGLMLNLLVLVFTISTTTTERVDAQVRRRVLREVFTNVCFCILIAICVTGVALVAISYMRSIPFAQTGPVATFLLAFLTGNFVLSLLMVVKRMYKLITTEFDSNCKKRAA
jgi:uncharacterized membrane protein